MIFFLQSSACCWNVGQLDNDQWRWTYDDEEYDFNILSISSYVAGNHFLKSI